jgi:hypothetical protein
MLLETTEQRLVRFLRETVTWLKQATSPEYQRWGTAEETREGGNVQLRRSGRPDFSSVLVYNRQNIPPYQEYCRDLAADPQFVALMGAVTPAGGRTVWLEPDFLARYLLLTYFEQVTSLDTDDRIAGEIAQNFAESVKRKTGGVRKLAPLNGFTSDLDEIECGEGFVIRRLRPDEYAELFDRFAPDRPSADWFPICEFAIEKVEESALDRPGGPIYAFDPHITRTITALRVLATGKVAATKMYNLPVRPGCLLLMAGTGGLGYAPQIHSTSYVFPRERRNELARLTALLKADNLPKQLRIALGRIDSAVERYRLEDTFIDYIVALEALYGDNSDGFPGGFTYKLAMRAAVFLHDELGNRQDTFDTMKKALRLRGGIVHGRLSAADYTVIEKVATIARESARKVLIEAVSSDKDFGGPMLDRLLLS